MIHPFKKYSIYLSILFFVFFIFYDLNWGAPYYFHPDERNIASSVSQLDITRNLNPNFFAYGSLPIYAIYLTGLINNFLQNPFHFVDYSVGFEEAIIISRIFSSIFSIFIVYIIFKITKELAKSNLAAYIAVLISTTSVAYLQYSHFGTFEMWLSLSYLMLFYYTYLFLNRGKNTYFALMSIFFGISISIKISSLFLVLLPVVAIFKVVFAKKKISSRIVNTLKAILVFLYLSSIVYIATNPFVILDTSSFLNSISYESSVAIGTLHVFYTESFINTTPILFQYMKILPFLLNPLVLLISTFGVAFLLYDSIRKKRLSIVLLIFSFLLIFISQSILYVKWTRYIIPSLSFLYIISSIFIFQLKYKLPTSAYKALLITITAFSVFFAFSFVKTVRLTEDSRLAASRYAQSNINPEAQVISEVYDLGIVPFNNYLNNITLFNFYDLDSVVNIEREFSNKINSSEYVILPSTRVLKSRIENSENYPEGHKFYSDLINNKTEFREIYKTPCDIFCKLIYLGHPIYNIEETINIFDRPTVFIFKKNL